VVPDVPHWQMPLAQRSELVAVHVKQLAPPEPHWVNVLATQVLPLQQPPQFD
jgi:hypothetical protein